MCSTRIYLIEPELKLNIRHTICAIDAEKITVFNSSYAADCCLHFTLEYRRCVARFLFSSFQQLDRVVFVLFSKYSE